jgi:hypothetical protein
MLLERSEERVAGRRIRRQSCEDNWENRRQTEGISVAGGGGGGDGRSIDKDFLTSE